MSIKIHDLINGIEIGGMNGVDIVTAAKTAFDNGTAPDLLAAVTEWDNNRQAALDDPIIQDLRNQVVDLNAKNDSANAEIESLNQQLIAASSIDVNPSSPTIEQLQQTIEQQRTQLSQLIITDWPGLMDDLKAAGFNRWLADAGSTNPDLLDEVARLYAAAKSGDRAGVITEFLAIVNAHPATTEQLQQWQAVLDARGIPKNLIAFIPA